MKLFTFVFLLLNCFKLIGQTPPWEWAKQSNGTGDNYAYSIVTNSIGEVIVCGQFRSQNLILDTITLLNSSVGKSDIFIAKYSSSGNIIWAKSFGGIENDYAIKAVVDHDDNVFVTGVFSSISINFDTTTLQNQSVIPKFDIFILKANSAGDIIWSKSFGGNYEDATTTLKINSNDEIWIAGSFWSTSISFDGHTLFNQGTPNINQDFFLTKLDSLGNTIWAISGGGNSDDVIRAIDLDNNNNVYITGEFTSPNFSFSQYTLSNLNPNFLIAKIESSGNVLWVKSALNTPDCISRCIAVNSGNRIYVSGYFQSPTIDFGNGMNLTNTGTGHDLYLLKMDTSGNIISLIQGSGQSNDGLTDISLKNDNAIIFCGQYSSTSLNLGNIQITNQSNSFTQDYFIGESDSSFNINWLKTHGTLDNDGSESITSDYLGNIYSTGWFEGTPMILDNSILVNQTIQNKPLFFVGKICELNKPNIISSNNLICSYDSIILSSSIPINQSCNWYYNGNLIVGNNNDSITVQLQGDYQLEISNGFNCNSISDIFHLSYFPLIQDSIISLNSSTICPGDTCSLTCLNQVFLNYQWQINSIPIMNGNSASINVIDSGMYSLVVIDNNNCVSTSNNVQVNLATNPNTFINPNGTINSCFGDSIFLYTNYNFGSNYQWLDNGQILLGAIDTFLQVTSNGSYSVFEINNNGCSDTSSVTTVNFITPLIVTITRSNDTLFSNLPFNNQWFLNGAILVNDTLNFYVFTPVTDDTLCFLLTNLNNLGCSTSDSICIFPGPSRINETQSGNFQISPNPSSNFLTIKSSNYLIDEILITNSNGVSFYHEQIYNTSLKIGVGNFPNGLYFITIFSEHGTPIRSKFIIQN